MNARPLVYRVYDAGDRLIYIGATKNLKQRLTNHRSLSWWNSLAARIDVEHHVDMAAAFSAEAQAIAAERPAFNLAHSGHYYAPPPVTAADLDVCRSWVDSSFSRRVHTPRVLRLLLDRSSLVDTSP